MAQLPFLGKNATIQIDGTAFTTDITNYSEDGGEENREFTKTMGRRARRRTISGKDNYTVSFDFSTLDTSFQSVANEGDVAQSLTITENDKQGNTITISYSNARVNSLNYEHDAEDRLVGTIEFNIPAYDSSGNDNRSVS